MEIIWNIFVSRIFVKEQQATAAGRKKECLRYEPLGCHNQILHIDISFLSYFALSIALSDISIIPWRTLYVGGNVAKINPYVELIMFFPNFHKSSMHFKYLSRSHSPLHAEVLLLLVNASKSLNSGSLLVTHKYVEWPIMGHISIYKFVFCIFIYIYIIFLSMNTYLWRLTKVTIVCKFESQKLCQDLEKKENLFVHV